MNPPNPNNIAITSAQANAVWERIAAFWDSYIGDGNDFQKTLIMPATDRLLGDVASQRILDIGCGNGNYARILSRRGARVVATDASEAFLTAAQNRTMPTDGSIEYLRVDATEDSSWQVLREREFDAAVCSMALMDMPTIEPLLLNVRRLIVSTGRLVFSVPHPCFSSNNPRMTSELSNDGSALRQLHGLAIHRYLTPTTDLSWGILHQPEPHYLFHRPLQVLLNACFASGWAMDGMEEPAFPAGTGGKNTFSFARRPEIPPAMIIRFRPV